MGLVLFLALLCAAAAPVKAQVVDLPLSHEAYGFMDRMEAKGLVTGFRDALRPIPRSTFARLVLALRSRREEMTSYEQEEQGYLEEEFHDELLVLAPDSLVTGDRWRMAAFDLFGGRMNATLNAQYEVRIDGKASLRKRLFGGSFYGTAYGTVGLFFNYQGINEQGTLFNAGKTHTPEQGVPYFGTEHGNEYNASQSGISYDLGKMNVSLEQTNMAWGQERFGNLAFSTKAPPSPKIKVRAALTDWMDLTYVHAELHSNVIDSLRSYDARSSSLRQFYRLQYRQKYFAAHILSLSPWEPLEVTLGESVVYSDRTPSLLYFLPVSFFKSGEHYNRDLDNTQMFMSFEMHVFRGLLWTGSLFVDEFSVADLADPVKERNQIGYSTGVQTYDIGMEGVETVVEYTHINPWVYSHKYPAATYTNNGFTMGDWIGQNADLLTVEASYRPMRALKVRMTGQLYRKGDTSDVANQYYPPAKPFLYGRQRIERSAAFALTYQPMHDAFIDASYRYGTVSDEQRPFPSRSSLHEFIVRVRYGVW